MKGKTYFYIGGVAFVLGLFLIGAKLYKDSQKEELSFLAKTNAEIFVRDHSPRYGDKNAKVFLFSDVPTIRIDGLMELIISSALLEWILKLYSSSLKKLEAAPSQINKYVIFLSLKISGKNLKKLIAPGSST